MRRMPALLAVLAIALPACALGTAAPPAAPLDTTTTLTGDGPVVTTTSVPVATTTTQSPVTTTTATTPATTTTTPTPTTTRPAPVVPSGPIEVVPYFFADEAGHAGRTGPFLVPVARSVPGTLGVARAAIDELLRGPTPSEAGGERLITTFVPEGVSLLGLTIRDGVATIDLSRSFEIDDDSAATVLRVAQVVYTLTRFDTVDAVLFHQDGVAMPAPTGDGRLVTRPVDRGDFSDLVAAIHVDAPAFGGVGGEPLRVTGVAAVFEAVFEYSLTDVDGTELAHGRAMTSNGTGWGTFDLSVGYDIAKPTDAVLSVWAHSAADGSVIDLRRYRVRLLP